MPCRPVADFAIRRPLIQFKGAFAVIEQQLKVPAPVRFIVGLPEVKLLLLPGAEVGIADTVQVMPGAAVPGVARGVGFFGVVIINVLAVGIQAFLQQPLRHMLRLVRIGNPGQRGFSVEVLTAIGSAQQPEARRVDCRLPVFDTVEAGFDPGEVARNRILARQWQAIEGCKGAADDRSLGVALRQPDLPVGAHQCIVHRVPRHAMGGASADGAQVHAPAQAEGTVTGAALVGQRQGWRIAARGRNRQRNLKACRTTGTDIAPALAGALDSGTALGHCRGIDLQVVSGVAHAWPPPAAAALAV
ncbi:hypothetical protein [Pseudomonas sp. 24 E 13]|nr:hypothetical protein [Pseudomonas sp. 24 E 13]